MERFTRLGEETIYAAHKIVSDHQQARMEPEHLMMAILGQKESPVHSALQQMNIQTLTLETRLVELIRRMPKAQPGAADVYLSYNCEQVIRKAEREADKLRDEYLNPEHLLLGIVQQNGTEVYQQLRKVGVTARALIAVMENVRSGQRITSRGDQISTEKTENSNIDEYCVNLVELAKANKFDPVIGRDEEVRRVIQVLSRRTKNNPLLTGEPGVGKTAIIEGLALRIHHGDVPESLKNSRLLSLDLAAMIAGAKYRGEFEDRLKGLLKELENSSANNILFIDELHTLVGAGASEGSSGCLKYVKTGIGQGNFAVCGCHNSERV